MPARLLTELIGTFFLVLTIDLTVLIGTEFAPIAIGSVLMALVYMGGPVSGAHYNPAVTLAIWLRGGIKGVEAGQYMGAQIVGALVAPLVGYYVNDRTLDVAPGVETTLSEFLLLEFLFTFALVLVVLNTATVKALANNSYYGLAIGFTVLAGAFAAGPISGGAFNPAVAIGPIAVDAVLGDASSLGGLWVYLAACFAGGALAALVFRLQHPAEHPAAGSEGT